MDAISEANLYLSYEKQRHDATRQRPVLPVTIITGFLGAGKTTLLRKILRSKHNLRIAAIVNEYASVDHDGGVVERDGLTDRVDKLAGGCVCCHGSLGSDLGDSVAELLRRPDHDRYDYLVIETSGVSDPEAIIRTLDKSFGKLTRARLDAVVTVMDADALLHQIGDEGQMDTVPVTVKRQLENADVIVLNKSDLLHQKQLSKLSDRVQELNGVARVLICSYGQLPLHTVLDVEAPRTDVQGVSHERVSTHLHVSAKGGNLRKASSSSQRNHSTTACSSGGRAGLACNADNKEVPVSGGHLRDDGLEQVTFTSSIPFSLARFQDWVCHGLPEGAVRVKGVLAFAEDKLTRCVFNMSGRRRISVENDGTWEGPMSLYLVVIGVRIDRAAVVTALENLLVAEPLHGIANELSAATASPPSYSAVPRRLRLEQELDEMRLLTELLAQDPLFDALSRNAAPECAPNVVRFRFTGAGAYGMPPSQLSIKFGVDLDSINRAILRTVNSGATGYRDPRNDVGGLKDSPASDETAFTNCHRSSDDTVAPSKVGGVNSLPARCNIKMASLMFLTCQEGVHLSGDGDAGLGQDEKCLVLRYAVGGHVSLVSAWPKVVERTRELMKTELGHIHFCKCFS